MSATGPPTWDECRSKGLEEIAAHIRPEASYILVDQDEWGIDELPLRRRRVPFVEHNGTYWGTPADDETAIGEFERLRQEGASFLVVARPAYWWLDYYHEWCHHLVSRFRCVLANDRVCIFDLQQSSDTDSAFAGLSDLIKNEGHGRRQQQRLIYPPGDLRNHERAVFSENGEDGILQEIFKRIGTDTKFFVEFGVGSGRYCNCARLVLEENWNGLFMECDSNSFRRLQRRFRGHQKVSCIQAMVTPQNFEALLATHHVPPDFDVLSIDIDGNDYWVWAALKHWHPRVVVIEYRAALAQIGRA